MTLFPACRNLIAEISGPQVSPAELMEARLLIEPSIPKRVARNATSSDFARMTECIERSEAAQSVKEFEHWDGELHRTFALATHNAFLLEVLELTNRVREQGEWGRLKRHSLTPARRKEYEVQHGAIVAALRSGARGKGHHVGEFGGLFVGKVRHRKNPEAAYGGLPGPIPGQCGMLRNDS